MFCINNNRASLSYFKLNGVEVMAAIYLLFVASVINIVGNIFMLVATNSWLYDSNVYLISQLPSELAVFAICSFLFVLFMLHIYTFKHQKIFALLADGICAFSGLVLLFFGLNWFIDPDSYFISIGKKWPSMLGSTSLAAIQGRLRCCGFKMVGEHPDDTCTDSLHKACFPLLKKRYSQNVRATGTFLLVNCVCLGGMCFILSLSSAVRGNRHYPRPSKTIIQTNPVFNMDL